MVILKQKAREKCRISSINIDRRGTDHSDEKTKPNQRPCCRKEDEDEEEEQVVDPTNS